jgi:hypothetical protein
MRFLKFIPLLCLTSSLYAQNDASINYFRHLRYNHVSPYIDLAGTCPIDSETADGTLHF